MFVHDGDEATTTPACSVMSESCVIRKLKCVVSVGVEFSVLSQCYVYVVFVLEVCKFSSFGYNLINV